MSIPDTDPSWSFIGAATAAVAASACCTIPLVLVSAGVGGAWLSTLSVLAPYRWGFVALSVAALGWAGYQEGRTTRPDCACESAWPPAMRRGALGVAGLMVLALLTTPWLVPAASTSSAPASPSAYRVVLTVEGMTCASCAPTVRRVLEQVEGVQRAEVTVDPPRAVVSFNPAATTAGALQQATEAAGFPSAPIDTTQDVAPPRPSRSSH